MGSDRLAVINGLRGLAICGVIYHHLFWHLAPPGTGKVEVAGWTLLPLAPLSNGWLGVSLFFVLSGFVLALPYERGARSLESRGDVFSFYLRRAARLLPLYYLVSVLSYVFLAPAQQSPERFAMLLTATFNFTKQTFFPAYNWVLWSLGIEIWMSVLFPALLALRRALGLGGFFALAAVSSAAVRVYGNQASFWGPNPVLNWMKDGLFGRLDDFALGMVLAAVFVHRGVRALHGWRSAVALGVAVVAFFTTAALWDAIRIGVLDRSWAPWLNNLFQLACAAGILGLLATDSRVARLLIANPVLQLLGTMCFSLYVWHLILIRPAGLGTIAGFTAENLVTYFVWLALISLLSYRYVEFGHIRDTRSLFMASGR